MTSTQDELPPVFKLDKDLVSDVFTILLDQDIQGYTHARDPYPLLLSISQVCRAWRRLVLDTPMLWHWINVGVLSRKSQEWRDEVLQRTQETPLYIYGNQIDSDLQSVTLMSLFRSHFSRTQVVDLVFRAEEEDQLVVDAEELRKIFNNPAPFLTKFSINTYINSNLDLRPTQVVPVLFDGNGAALTVFRSNHFYPDIALAPSLNRLSSLSVSNPYTVLETLKLVDNLPLLRSLAISLKPDDPQITVPLPHIDNPATNIETIKLTSTSLVQIIELLDHMNFRLGHQRLVELNCSLTTPANFMPVRPSHIAALRRMLQSFTSITPTEPLYSTSITTSSKFFSFEMRDVYQRFFNFTVGQWDGHDNFSMENKIPALMDLFSLCDFTRIKSLFIMSLPGIPSSINDSLFVFYQRFESVTHLETWSPFMQHFGDTNLSDLFPRLMTISLNDPWTGFGTPNPSSLVQVLQNWHTSSSMTRTVNLRRKPVGINFSMLDDIPNLRVTWGYGPGEDYLCGTGHPELLDFSIAIEESS